jgi:threonylcarbamoyladenosine tRNA methylthiotransferase MtaB
LLLESDVPRLRLGSVEPTEIPDQLLELLAGSEVLCPHLHIPLQAGDDAVLARMQRHYDTAFFRTLLERISLRLPEAAIGLDVIVGFPGESEEEFARTEAFLAELPFSHLHVFPFSRRPGTPAATMAGQIPASVAKERAARLRAFGDAKLADFARRFIGRELEVVVEGGNKQGLSRGLTRNYLPVLFPAATQAEKVARVRITDWRDGALYGEPL